MPTLEQERAEYAWSQVQNAVRGFGSKYTNIAKSCPALVMNNGLMQTLAFLNSKDSHHRALNDHIIAWLYQRGIVISPQFATAMDSLHQATPSVYRRATQETLELLKWLRQYAAASE